MKFWGVLQMELKELTNNEINYDIKPLFAVTLTNRQ